MARILRLPRIYIYISYICCRDRILATFWPLRSRVWSPVCVQILLLSVLAFVFSGFVGQKVHEHSTVRAPSSAFLEEDHKVTREQDSLVFAYSL